jgi:auxin response factor
LQGQEVFRPFRGGCLADGHIGTAGMYQPCI